jgi:hypothetical protein
MTDLPIIDCACVIHGDAYDWDYVEKLNHMVARHLPNHYVKFHVYTEESRWVPKYMIKHVLHEWPGVAGPKRAWWYKLQLFNAEHHSGNLLYFDLDTVIVRDLTWITECDPVNVWTVRDFKYLQNPDLYAMNSSVMWWNVPTFNWAWQKFIKADVADTIRQHRLGDQEYLNKTLTHRHIRFFDQNLVQSWRWQANHGGVIFPDRVHREPGTGTKISESVSVLVFHGNPKPHQIADPVIKNLWR